MASSQITPTLAQAMRAKYPGAYDDMDDATLEKNVLAKYPQYADMARSGSSVPSQVKQAMAQSTQSKANQALSGTGIQVGPMPGVKPPDYDPGVITRAADALGGALSAPPGTPGAAVEQALSGNFKQANKELHSGRPLTVPFGTPSGTMAQVQSAAGRIGSGDVAGGLGELAAPVLQAIALHKIGKMVSPEAAPLPKDAAVNEITNAVNPAPEDMPKFRADLGQHLDSILQTAKQQGIPTDSVSGLAKAINATSDNAHDLYMNQMVKPIANDVISVPDSVNVGNSKVTLTASVGDIVGRLKEINDTLSPKYNKAGLAGQAAIGAEQAAPLRAEAATLRSTLNDYMAKKLDIPVEQVVAARQNMGSLRQLGEDVQYYSDKSLNQANAASNAKVAPEITLTGATGRGMQYAFRALRGLPADRKVAGAVNNYRAQAVPRPVLTMMEKTQAPSYQPSWMTPGTDSSLSVSGNFPTNDTGTPPDFNERYF